MRWTRQRSGIGSVWLDVRLGGWHLIVWRLRRSFVLYHFSNRKGALIEHLYILPVGWRKR